jgi:hypothetical protein
MREFELIEAENGGWLVLAGRKDEFASRFQRVLVGAYTDRDAALAGLNELMRPKEGKTDE